LKRSTSPFEATPGNWRAGREFFQKNPALKSSLDPFALRWPACCKDAASQRESMSTKITMYLGAMDHSPSEQLGQPYDWHTTVLILSEGGEHTDAAKDVALRLGCRNGLLRKWSKNPRYRQKGTFGAVLMDVLPRHAVVVRVICAQARTISHSYPHMIEQLRLTGLVESFAKNEKPYLKFGPFNRVTPEGNSEPVYFDIIERQALPLIFICHYVLRMHRKLMLIIKRQRPEIDWVDLQLMPNKFPGDVSGPMASLFHAIMSGAAHQRLVDGTIRIMTFANAKDDMGSSFADNIAGWVSEELVKQPGGFAFPVIGDSFDGEIWRITRP
jgi:hypothetical protein